MPRKRASASRPPRKIRYAVVGLGYISQAAVLPAFRHARKNSELAAIVSDDPTKLRTLARRHDVPRLYDYDGFSECLEDETIDAVYIALPNAMHKEWVIRSARAGKHVLCEKPLAVSAADCEAMITAAAENGVRLMTAYRLHFEKANLKAIETVRSGRLGEPRIFQSVFTMQVENGNIRLSPTAQGGGPIYDIGIYCINAARYLFRAEPEEAFAWTANVGDKRFRDCPEMMTCVLRFPVQRLATFTCSFGAAETGWYQVVGTKGDLRMDPAYELAEPLVQRVTVGGRTSQTTYPKRDQFAPELLYFSDCILKNREPEPSGREGLADVRIIEALLESARTARPVKLDEFERGRRPTMAMEKKRPPVPSPRLVHAEAPSGH
ncbi:MAG TPA: Gfo/Idh/MocA family oxidoreductase [Thermoanaerobaculia bacterium]